MEAKKLINLMDVKEMQAFAYLEYYVDKMPISDLQKAVDEYCDRMAEGFINNHYPEFSDEETLVVIRRHISRLGADKAHSGKRFYEAVSKRLKQFSSSQKERD